MNKRLDLKHYLLIFIETFNIWQMGMIFYSSKALTLNDLIETPVLLDDSIFFIFIGYIIGILAIYFLPQKTILLGRISMLISLFASVLLLLPISHNLFYIIYYLLTFNCVFFISINTSLIINYYSLKTCITDVMLGGLISGLFIAICQNQIIPLTFKTFNIISIICLTLISFALFKLPSKFNIKFISKGEKIKLPPKKLVIGLILILLIASLNTLFSSALSADIHNGVSITYLGSLISAIIFILLYKVKNINPLIISKYYFVIVSLGFLLYLLPIDEVKYISLLLQGFGYFLLLLIPYFINNLFEQYPSKLLAPLTVLIALIAVFISSGILHLERNEIVLYSIYSFISIFSITIYLLLEKNLEFDYLNKNNIFDKLTTREKEVAELLIKGYSAKEISKELFISTYTVKDHLKSIYKKYEVNSKMKLIEKINN